jgi:hypothetical protein
VITGALHPDFMLTESQCSQGRLYSTGSREFRRRGLLRLWRYAVAPPSDVPPETVAIFQVMLRIDQLNFNGGKQHVEQEKLP